MAKAHLALVTPGTVFGSVKRGPPPKRRRNVEVRSREYLTASEVEQLIATAGNNRYGHRDATMVLVAYRHGLRPTEAVALRWDAIDFNHGQIHIARGQRQCCLGSSVDRPRAARPTPLEARARSSVAVRVYIRARRTVRHRRLPYIDCTLGRSSRIRFPGPSAHAPARLRIQARERRRRHSQPASVPRPSQYSAHCALHRISADSLQGFLARLTWRKQRYCFASHSSASIRESLH
jgi:integrase